VETVAEGVNGAWFQFLPDGRMLVAEKNGRIRIVSQDGRLSSPPGGMPANMYAVGQSLYSVQPDRRFAANRTIYLAYAVLPEGVDAAKQRTPSHVHVASARISSDDTRLEDVKDLLDAEGTGGRVIQATDGTLLIETTVPAGLGIKSEDWMQPQQLDSLMGKVLRINADGSIPKDNPFASQASARPEIYALGFRDPQGLAIQPKTGKLWTSEHGPRGGDEINAVEKGKNYGFRSSATDATTWASRSTTTRPHRPGWNSPCISGPRISRRPASPSTRARCFLPGRAICSCPSWRENVSRGSSSRTSVSWPRSGC
jgi:glucose/arabinose dehydrogenase